MSTYTIPYRGTTIIITLCHFVQNCNRSAILSNETFRNYALFYFMKAYRRFAFNAKTSRFHKILKTECQRNTNSQGTSKVMVSSKETPCMYYVHGNFRMGQMALSHQKMQAE